MNSNGRDFKELKFNLNYITMVILNNIENYYNYYICRIISASANLFMLLN